MAKSLKTRTEELLLNHLENCEWYDQALYAYTNSLLNIMAEEGSRSVRDLEALVRLVSKYATYLDPALCSKDFEWTQQEKMEGLSNIKNFLTDELCEQFPEVPFSSQNRIKTLESFMEKIWRRGSTPSKAESDLKDMIAARFVLAGRTVKEYVPECYFFIDTIIDSLFEEFKPIPGKLKATDGFDPSSFDPEVLYIPQEIPSGLKYAHLYKDYIRKPKVNGYQGLQISLYSPQQDLYLEIQVKTQIMYENSEFYESSHDDNYKKDGENGGLAGIDHRLFDGYDLRKLNNLHGFRSRDGHKFVDNLGILVPRSF